MKMRTIFMIMLCALIVLPLGSAGAKDYAVLVTAGITTQDGSIGNSEYWYDLTQYYFTLIDEGFEHEDIFVLYGNGSDYSSGRPAYQNPYPDPITDMDNSLASIETVLTDSLASRMTGDDCLFFYWMGHGGSRPSGDLELLIENQDQSIWDYELAAWIDEITDYQSRYVIFSTCNSGGIIDDLAGPNTVIMTSVEYGAACFSEIVCDNHHMEFNYFAYTGLHGETPGLVCGFVDADGNGDNSVSLEEAYDYVYDGMISTTPQFSDPGNAWARYLSSSPVRFQGYSVNDDESGSSSGNGDGRIDPGETVEMPVTLVNTGGNTVYGVNAVLSLAEIDPYVTILDNQESFGDIASQSSAVSVDDFDFSVAGGCPDGHLVRFDLDVSDGAGQHWQYEFKVTVGGLKYLGEIDPDMSDFDMLFPLWTMYAGRVSDAEWGTGTGLPESGRVWFLTTTYHLGYDGNIGETFGKNALPGIVVLEDPNYTFPKIMEYDVLTGELVNIIDIPDTIQSPESETTHFGGLAFDTRTKGFWYTRESDNHLFRTNYGGQIVGNYTITPDEITGMAFDSENNHLWCIEKGGIGQPDLLWEYDVSSTPVLIQGPLTMDWDLNGASGLEYDERTGWLIATHRSNNRIYRFCDIDPDYAGPAGSGTPGVELVAYNGIPLVLEAAGCAVPQTVPEVFIADNRTLRPRPLREYGFFTVMSGSITDNTVLDGDVWMKGDVLVGSSFALTIAEGTRVYVSPVDGNNLGTDPARCEIIVEGQLAIGSSTGNVVHIESGAADAEAGDWAGIVVAAGAGDVTIENTCLSHAVTGIGYANTSTTASLTVSSSVIEQCVTGVNLTAGQGDLTGVNVSGCTGKGFYADGTVGPVAFEFSGCSSEDNEYGFYFGDDISGCTMVDGTVATGNEMDGIFCYSGMDIGPDVSSVDNGRDGIHLEHFGSTGVIDDVFVTGNTGGAGCMCVYGSSPEIKNSYFNNNYDNISAKYTSYPVLGDQAASKGMHNSILTPIRYHVANFNKRFTMMAEYCYWGPCGPGYLPAINISGSVDLVPWLESPPAGSSREIDPVIPKVDWISQNYPNPFNPVTRIDYYVTGQTDRVSLKVFDITGRLVRDLVDDTPGTGIHTAVWDGKNQSGSDVASGLYFYRITIGSRFTKTSKMILLR